MYGSEWLLLHWRERLLLLLLQRCVRLLLLLLQRCVRLLEVLLKVLLLLVGVKNGCYVVEAPDDGPVVGVTGHNLQCAYGTFHHLLHLHPVHVHQTRIAISGHLARSSVIRLGGERKMNIKNEKKTN